MELSHSQLSEEEEYYRSIKHIITGEEQDPEDDFVDEYREALIDYNDKVMYIEVKEDCVIIEGLIFGPPITIQTTLDKIEGVLAQQGKLVYSLLV